jgi:hypothetical protein
MADKIVEIPNIGPVAFPATMTDDEIIRAIGNLMGGAETPAPALAPTPAMPPDTLGRQMGLAVRPAAQAAMTGLGLLPMAVDPLVNLYNLATGSQAPTMTQAVGRTLTGMGFPEPRTAQERIVQDVAGAGYSVGGLANLSARALPMLKSPMAQGTAQMFATNPRAQSSAALASTAAGGLLREGEFSPGVQLAGALGAGMMAPGGPTLSTTQRALAAPQALFQPLSVEGRQIIAGNVLRSVTTDPERAIQNLQSAQSTVPNFRLTTAAAARDPGLAGAETTLRSALFDPTKQFSATLSSNQQALLDSFRRLSGRPGSIVRAETKRDELTGPMREAAFANAQPVSVEPIAAAIQGITSNPATQRQTVDQAMKYVTDLLAKRVDPETGTINPMALYSVRKDIGVAMSGKLSGDAANLKLAKGELRSLLPVIDAAIESGAPGFNRYMQQFEKSSSAIDQMRVLQGIQDRVTTGQPNIMTGEPVLAAGALRQQLKVKSDELDLKLSPAAQRRLDNIIYEINRGQAATAPGVTAPGSNTFQNLTMGNLIGRVFSESLADNTTLRTMTRPLDFLYKLPNQQIQQLLVEAMLDPQLAAQMMSKASIMKVEPMAKSLRRKAEELGFGAAIGASQE